MKLEGARVLVTGASSGIGAALAPILAERGATVGIVGRSLYNYRDHEGVRLTLRDPAQLVRTLERILDKHGVVGDERQELIARHARWFGRPIHAVRGPGVRP